MPIRIVYTSRLQPELDDVRLGRLISDAAAFNAAHLITGVMAVEDGRVCQILEGKKTAVEALYDRISLDSRHASVSLLVHAPIENCHFQEWGMVRAPMIDIVTFALSISNDLEQA